MSRSAQGLNGVGKPWFKSYPVLCRMLEGSVAAAGMWKEGRALMKGAAKVEGSAESKFA